MLHGHTSTVAAPSHPLAARQYPPSPYEVRENLDGKFYVERDVWFFDREGNKDWLSDLASICDTSAQAEALAASLNAPLGAI